MDRNPGPACSGTMARHQPEYAPHARARSRRPPLRGCVSPQELESKQPLLTARFKPATGWDAATLPATWGLTIDRHAGRSCSREHVDQAAPPQGRPVGTRIRRRRVGIPAGARVPQRYLRLAAPDPAARDPRTPDRSAHCPCPRVVPRRSWRAACSRHRASNSDPTVPRWWRSALALRPRKETLPWRRAPRRRNLPHALLRATRNRSRCCLSRT